MKRLLVASDLSARGERAIARGIQIAGRDGASVTVLHVIDGELPRPVADAQESASRKELEATVARIDADGRVSPEVRIVRGQAYRSIVEEAAALGADLLVLGTHRNEAGALPIVGSTLERVVRESPVPLLVAVRAVNEPYGNAVVAVDFSVFTKAALAAAATLAPRGALHLVHVYHVPFSGFLADSAADRVRTEHQGHLVRIVREEMESLASGGDSGALSGRSIRSHLLEGEVRAVLRRQVDALGAELLVLETHRRGALARAWLGSVAEAFLAQPPCDILVVGGR